MASCDPSPQAVAHSKSINSWIFTSYNRPSTPFVYLKTRIRSDESLYTLHQLASLGITNCELNISKI